MKTIAKQMILVLCAILLIASLAACQSDGGSSSGGGAADGGTANAGDGGSDDSGDSGATGDETKLTFFFPVNVGGDIADLIDGIAADYNAENPGVIIEPVYTGNYDDTVVKIQTAVQGGTPPDFFLNLATQRFSMANAGFAIPLDDLIAADGDEGQAYIDDFLPGFMLDSYVDGKIYSIPFQRSTMILYYNKDAFTEVGLDPESPPENWDQLVEYATALTNENRYGVGLALNSGSAQWSFTGFCIQNSENGENLMSDDGKQVFFNTPGNVEALQFWLDLQNEYGVMQEGIVQWTDLPGQFLEGQVAMIYHTTGNLTNINSNADFAFGTAYLPAGKRYGAPTGGGNFYISAGIDEERQQIAWDFIKYATSTERAAQWNIDTGYVATRNSCYDTDLIKNYYAELPQAAVARDQLDVAQPELTTYDAAEIWRVLNDNIQSAVTGEYTAEEAMANAQAEADEILSRYQ